MGYYSGFSLGTGFLHISHNHTGMGYNTLTSIVVNYSKKEELQKI